MRIACQCYQGVQTEFLTEKSNGAVMAANTQKGFTLLELMVAMAIFAMLAVAGWQIFNSIHRSKERAEMQMDVLTDLQYGYQQMQRDMVQVVDYKVSATGASSGSSGNNNSGLSSALALNGAQAGSNQDAAATDANNLQSAFSLLNNRLSFIRHADPDPRFAQSVSFERIVYTFENDNLVRERYTILNDDSNEKPLKSVVVEDVSEGSLQVLLPQSSIVYPDEKDSASSGSIASLPKGVNVNFSVQLGNIETPIEWTYALTNSAPQIKAAHNSSSDDNGNKKNDGGGNKKEIPDE